MEKNNFDIELVKIINIIYELNNFSDHNINRLLDSFNYNLFLSRTVIYNELKNKGKKYNNICILGSWYGVWMVMMLNRLYPNCKITCIDIEPNLDKIAKRFYKELGYNVIFKETDALNYIRSNNMLEHDLIINYSCEHMNDLNNYLKFNHCDYILQSNNNDKCIEHTNCKYSLDEFVKSTGLGNVYSKIIKSFKNMERYTVFGTL